jgi:hypothetical protein
MINTSKVKLPGGRGQAIEPIRAIQSIIGVLGNIHAQKKYYPNPEVKRLSQFRWPAQVQSFPCGMNYHNYADFMGLYACQLSHGKL